jgi:hypothetical protein
MEQGSFAKLRSSGKYVQSLDITDPHPNNDSSETISKQDVIEEIENLVEDSKALEQEKEEEQPVSSDRSTFKYYFASMRPISLALGGAYIIGQAFSSTFRCK